MDDLGYPLVGNFHVLKPWTTAIWHYSSCFERTSWDKLRFDSGVPHFLKSHTIDPQDNICRPWRIPGLEDKIRFQDERNGYCIHYSAIPRSEWMYLKGHILLLMIEIPSSLAVESPRRGAKATQPGGIRIEDLMLGARAWGGPKKRMWM